MTRNPEEADVKLPLKLRWRLLRMHLSTMLGGRQGFFSPYRYAAGVQRTAYPELEPAFEAALTAGAPDDVPGMAAYLDQAEGLVEEIDAATGAPPRPRWEQNWFTGLDAVAAYMMARQPQTRRIIEVGSGHSTRFLAAGAAAREAAGHGHTEITCIDPAPRANLMGLPVSWQQEVLGPQHFDMFRALGPGDIAFFDSSHLLWPGSDVDLILNRILPGLAPGVLVHFHDILLPDAYPDVWSWRGYTEQLGLGGWLVGGSYQLIWASHWLGSRDELGERARLRNLPAAAMCSSIWLRRSEGS